MKQKTSQIKQTFSPESTLADVLDHPEGEQLLTKYEFPCPHCPFAQIEMSHLKLKDIANNYNLNLEKFLTEINQKTR